jgi:hypothetical protein
MSFTINISFSIPDESYSMVEVNQMLRRGGFVDPECYAIELIDSENNGVIAEGEE